MRTTKKNLFNTCAWGWWVFCSLFLFKSSLVHWSETSRRHDVQQLFLANMPLGSVLVRATLNLRAIERDLESETNLTLSDLWWIEWNGCWINTCSLASKWIIRIGIIGTLHWKTERTICHSAALCLESPSRSSSRNRNDITWAEN